MRGFLMFKFHCKRQSHKDSATHEPQPLKSEDSRSGESNQSPSAYLPNALPLDHTDSQETGE